MRRLRIACGALLLLVAGAAAAQEPDEGSCVYDRVVYPDGSQVCQEGMLMSCQDGAWTEIGDCSSDAAPPPTSGGGDEELPGE